MVRSAKSSYNKRFLKSVTTLASGTAGGQVITFIALPVLTRLYTPDDFSLLAVYVSIFTIVSAVACLRLEIAIPLPSLELDAVNLLMASLFFAFFSSLISALVLYGMPTKWFLNTGSLGQIGLLWIIPFGIFLGASYSALQFWATRQKRFSSIAKTRLVQAGSGAFTQIALGWWGIVPLGLLLGQMMLNGAGSIRLGLEALRYDHLLLRKASVRGVLGVVRAYKQYPQYSTIESFANSASVQVPVLMIATLAIGPEAGFILLASRAIGTPVTLIGKAVSQVFLSEAPESYRNGSLGQLSYKVVALLAVAGVFPLFLLGLFAPILFEFLFGQNWSRAGELVTWMTPWFLLKLLSSPIAMVMHVKMLQFQLLLLMLFGLCIRVLVTLAAFVLDASFLAEAYAISGALFYGFASFVYMKAAGLSAAQLVNILGIVLLGISASFLVYYLASVLVL